MPLNEKALAGNDRRFDLRAGFALFVRSYLLDAAMEKKYFYIVNALTLYRLVTAPLLIFLAFNDRADIFKWLLAASFLTDAFDGYLSRRFKVASIAGSKLDSIADQ